MAPHSVAPENTGSNGVISIQASRYSTPHRWRPNVQRPLTPIALLKEAALLFPKTPIASRERDGSLYRCTIDQFYERVKRLASALKRLGIQAGDGVGVLEFNTHRYLELFFAVTGLGATVISIEPQTPSVSLNALSAQKTIRTLFASDLLLPQLSSTHGVETTICITPKEKSALHFEALLQQEPSQQSPWPLTDETSPALICHGEKALSFSQRDICLHTLTAAAHLSIGSHDVLMQASPLFQTSGWALALVALFTGRPLVLPGILISNSAHWLKELMVEERITLSCWPPKPHSAALAAILPPSSEQWSFNEWGRPAASPAATPLFKTHGSLGAKGSAADAYWNEASRPWRHTNRDTQEQIASLVHEAISEASFSRMEAILMGSEAICEATVVGIPHPTWQERPLALVVARNPDHSHQTTEKELYRLLAEKLTIWEIPDEILFVESLSRSTVGKLAKGALKKTYQHHYTKRDI